ncbi:T9SS C-terminal target domain-containing protein [Indibacter alkaliphilus]|uniref:T9SS C-terminal target domain-containing protein n=1 Tax=Indibacter alkaliphilus TaxID=579922 RepID=UPI00058AF155|nr:T9SS C-terminal target domain-containing protein [Indibacter alkaliphilus]
MDKKYTIGLIRFVFFWALLGLYSPNLLAQVIIPRDGFPYCEPFTGSGFRQNTVLGGSPNIPILTASTPEHVDGQGFLRLTNNNNDQRGYVFVDLPFSSAYGLKFSFEYFMYGGSGADGISVFLFDGNISEADFQIGGWGGSLGYAPINAPTNVPPVILPGLKGGYLGLGLDAFKNFGNNMEGRFGGFDDPNAPPINTSFIPPALGKDFFQSISIRGPETEDYRFIAGKRVLHGPDNEPNPAVLLPPASYLYPNVADIDKRFSLASAVKAVDCDIDGYRKVFVNLKPVGGGFYLLSIDMLVRSNGFRRVEPIVTDIPYNFPAPENLKIGFAASTGGQTNFHEIRNVTVEVSDYLAIPIPEVDNLRAEICENEENLFEFDVTLTSDNSFVRCVQLYENDPLAPNNTPPTGGDPSDNNCGASDVCIEKCNPLNNSVTIPGKGTFTVELDVNVDLSDDEDRVKAAIKFVPEPGFLGEAEIYYQVIDNYGLTSFAKTVTVVSNPFPEEKDKGDIDFPTCDGQGNGRIFDVEVSSLVNGFDYEWIWQPVSGTEVNLGKSGASEVFDSATGIGLFELDNVNLGTYTLKVWNPSDEDGCPLEIPIEVDQELGTPVELTSEEEVICAFQPVSFTPFIDGQFNPTGIQADFRWYRTANRTGALVDGTTVTINDRAVQVEVSPEGILTLTGLPSDGANIQSYEFFVEVASQNNSNFPNAPNFCPFIGDIQTTARVTVHPPINANWSSDPDWCRAGIGTVSVSATGGNGDKTFRLLDLAGQQLQGPNSTGEFTGLLPGEYEVEVTSSGPDCIELIDVNVQGPEEDLLIIEEARQEASCELDNGRFSFEISGGNTPYSSSNISISGGPSSNLIAGSGGVYTYEGLAPNTPYTITFTDAQGCPASMDFTLNAITKPVFDIIEPAPVCEDQSGLFIDVTYDFFEIQATAVPIFNWYTEPNGGSPIGNGNGPFWMVYDINNANGQLNISGLQAGVYTLYLEMSGPDACDLPREAVTFEIFALPEIEIAYKNDVSCFGGNDGEIEINVLNGSITDFEFRIDGPLSAGYQDAPVFNTGIIQGTYQVFVRNKITGCEESTSIVVEQPDSLVLDLMAQENSFCGQENGTINIRISGGSPIYELLLDGTPVSGFDFSIDGLDITLTDLSPGDHELILRDSNLCETGLNFTVEADPFAEFDALGDIICVLDGNSGSANTAVLSPVIIELASASPVFIWYYLDGSGNEVQINTGDNVLGANTSIDGNGILSLTGLPASATPYKFFLDVSGDRVCVEPKIEVEVLVNPLPAPEFDFVAPTCHGASDGEIILTANGEPEFSYELVSTGEINNSGQFTGLSAGTYQVRATNTVTSCFDLIEVIISEPDPLLISLENLLDTSCNEDNGLIEILISGGTPGYSMLLDGEEQTALDLDVEGSIASISGLAPGTYSIQVLDANGCELSETITIEASPIPVFGVSNAEICEQDPVSGESITAVLSPEIIDLAGSVPVFTWYYIDAQGDTLQINSGDEIFGAQVSINAGDLNLTGLTASENAYEFLMDVSGDGVCPAPMIPATILVNPLPAPIFEVVDLTCFESNDGQINLTAGGKSSYTYSLNTGESNQTGSFSNLAAGDYSVRVEDPNGCFSIFELGIQEPSPLQVQAVDSTDPSCGDSNGELTFSVNGGTSPYIITVNGQGISDFEFEENSNNYTLTGLSPGSYSVKVRDENGCELEVNGLFNLVNNEGVSVDSQPISAVYCEANTAALVPDINVPAGVVPELRWYKTSNTSQPVVSSSDPAEDGIIYNIVDGVLYLEGIGPGVYTYYLRISGQGICTQLTEANLEILEGLTASVEVEPITCFGDENGLISVGSVSGGSGGYEFSLDGNNWQSESSFDQLASGIYTIYIRDAVYQDGCQLLIPDVLVDAPEQPITANTPDVFRASCGLDNGRIFNLQVTGGWGDFTFEWKKDDPISGQSLSGGTLAGIENLAPGTYFLLVKDDFGCEAVFDFEIGTAPDPEYELIPPMDVCEGQDVILAPVHLASGAPASPTDVFWYKLPSQNGLISEGLDPDNAEVSYAIDDSNWINPVLTVSGLAPGVYTFYFYVSCTDTEMPIQVTVHPTPVPIIEVERESCAGSQDGSIKIVGNAPSDWVYSVNNGPWESRTALEGRNFGPGIYALQAKNSFDCISEVEEVEIIAAQALSLELLDSKDAACGTSDGLIAIGIKGGWPAYTLKLTELNSGQGREIQTSDSTYTFNQLPLGNYEVSVTDAEGCSFTLANGINIEDGPTEILIDNLFEVCEGEIIDLLPDVNPASSKKTFRWYRNMVSAGNEISNGQTIGGVNYQINAQGRLRISGLSSEDSPAVYFVTVEGPEICEGDQKRVEVRVYPDPQFTATAVDENCFGEGGSIIINPVASAANIRFSLNGSAFTTYPNNIIENLQPGSYTLTAEHASGCTFTLAEPVVVSGPDAALSLSDAKAVDASCAEENGMLSMNVNGGTAPYTVSLQMPNGNWVTPSYLWSNDLLEISSIGIGSYKIQITDAAGCQVISEDLIVGDSPTPLRADDVFICEGEIANLIPSIPNSSLSPTYKWYLDPNGNNQINSGYTTAEGAIFTISSIGRVGIEGLPANSQPYKFYVTVEGSGVCDAEMVEVLVQVDPLPQLRTSNPSIVCDPNETVDLTQFIEGFNPDVFDYFITSPTGASLRLADLRTINQSGTYLVEMGFKGSACRTSTERILVLIADELNEASFDYQLEILPGQVLVNQDINILEDVEFIDQSKGDIVIWNWDFGDGNTSSLQNPVHQYSEKGDYVMKLVTIDSFGCQSEFTRLVQVYDDYLIEIPNAFTPSRFDGKNNFFVPKFRGLADMKLYVFNTWGDLIFEGEGLENRGWDGTLNGVEVPNGNYVYKAEFLTRSGEKVNRTGVFLLIR